MRFAVLSCFVVTETRVQILLPYVLGIAVLCLGLWCARKKLGMRPEAEALVHWDRCSTPCRSRHSGRSTSCSEPPLFK